MNTDPIVHGGLMRCDIETIHLRETPGVEGEIQQCAYSHDSAHRAIFSNGAWHWLTPGWAEQLVQDSAVSRTLDVAEATADKARAVGLARETAT